MHSVDMMLEVSKAVKMFYQPSNPALLLKNNYNADTEDNSI